MSIAHTDEHGRQPCGRDVVSRPREVLRHGVLLAPHVLMHTGTIVVSRDSKRLISGELCIVPVVGQAAPCRPPLPLGRMPRGKSAPGRGDERL